MVYPTQTATTPAIPEELNLPAGWLVKNDASLYKDVSKRLQRAPVNFNRALPNISELWRESKGKGIRIAILDTGIDSGHPALTANIVAKKNFTGGDSLDVTDNVGHGTMVAGVIAAHDSTHVVGVAPEVDLYVAKVINSNSGNDLGALLAGIDWAVEQKVDVINISMVTKQDLLSLRTKIQAAAAAKIFVICAAGNKGAANGVEFPAAYDECIAVGAVTRANNRWESSPESSAIGRQLDIMALGDSIHSTFPLRKDPSGESIGQGTSLAAPFVTGVVALALAKHRLHGGNTPITNFDQLKEHLLKTAIDLPLPSPLPTLVPDPEFGYGLIDPLKFLAVVGGG